MKARAAIFTGARKPFEMREYEVPEVEPGAALVKVSLANVCGSDLHVWRGESPFPVGTVGGHEMTGTIVSLGAGLDRDATGKPLKEGDRIACPYFIFCGSCRPCLRGHRTACQKKTLYWATPADRPPHFRGAYAEYYYSPPGNPIFKVPNALRGEMVAAANCALSQVIYGLSQASMNFGDAVVVQGAGGLGIYCAAVAKEMGAGITIVLDRDSGRLDLARAFGADEVVHITADQDVKDTVSQIRKLTGGQGADVVMGLVGVPSAVPDGLKMLGPGGRMIEMGNIGMGAMAQIDPGYMVLRGVELKTVMTYEPWALGAALDFLDRTQTRLPLDRIVSHKFPFGRINDAFERADRGEILRAALVFQEESGSAYPSKP